MADYFVGDLQGCFDGLQQALAEVEFSSSKDILWLTGDLIARGEQSLQTLEFLYKNQDSVKTVLGNHDLHFLSVANKVKKENPKDLLTPLLQSPKLTRYIDWLRLQPLVLTLPDNSGFMSHAGLAPDWQVEDAVYWSQQVQSILMAKDYTDFLPSMYGKKPTKWHQNLSELDKIKYAINALTRMRYCSLDGELEFDTKCAPQDLADKKLLPWFQFNKQRFKQHKWIFGHWASLMGETKNKNIIALDTGYVWGQYLTIYELKKDSYIKVRAIDK
jgi:bis(5'-nucleosyl)-tetraphosphatase (symmetrical)